MTFLDVSPLLFSFLFFFLPSHPHRDTFSFFPSFLFFFSYSYISYVLFALTPGTLAHTFLLLFHRHRPTALALFFSLCRVFSSHYRCRRFLHFLSILPCVSLYFYPPTAPVRIALCALKSCWEMKWIWGRSACSLGRQLLVIPLASWGRWEFDGAYFP